MITIHVNPDNYDDLTDRVDFKRNGVEIATAVDWTVAEYLARMAYVGLRKVVAIRLLASLYNFKQLTDAVEILEFVYDHPALNLSTLRNSEPNKETQTNEEQPKNQ